MEVDGSHSTSEHMDSLGNTFKTARESQGLTLGQMVSRTRIQEPHLKALEEGSFEQLPEQVFTKGFVRAYARSLNLDEEECLRLFVESSASFYQKEGEGLPKFFLLKEDEYKEENQPNHGCPSRCGTLPAGGTGITPTAILFNIHIFPFFATGRKTARSGVIETGATRSRERNRRGPPACWDRRAR